MTKPFEEQDIVEKLRTRAEIRRNIPGRRSVQEGAPDRIADLCDEAADEILKLRMYLAHSNSIISGKYTDGY